VAGRKRLAEPGQPADRCPPHSRGLMHRVVPSVWLDSSKQLACTLPPFR
jgi:hypothetical protein